MVSEKLRTEVHFKSDSFNSTQPKDYFINEGCFGDDVCRWLIQELRSRGLQTDAKPSQEDFGWYFSFRLNGNDYCFIIGYRPGAGQFEGDWFGWLEREVGLVAT